jgi:hypothetical protein
VLTDDKMQHAGLASRQRLNSLHVDSQIV